MRIRQRVGIVDFFMGDSITDVRMGSEQDSESNYYIGTLVMIFLILLLVSTWNFILCLTFYILSKLRLYLAVKLALKQVKVVYISWLSQYF